MLLAAQAGGKGSRDTTCAISMAHAYDLLLRYGLAPFDSYITAVLGGDKSVLRGGVFFGFYLTSSCCRRRF